MSFIRQINDSYLTVYGEDYTYRGVEFLNEESFFDFLNKVNESKSRGLKKLTYDKKRSLDDLPAQLISNKKIDLTANFDTNKFGIFLDSTSRTIKETDPNNILYFINPTPGFLGATYFGNNFVVFDANPYILVDSNKRPLFPGYDPIYYKTTLDEILEYIYTVVYPTENIPHFPNFVIGDVAIDGTMYNPMYDIRNFRLEGTYTKLSTRDTSNEVFTSTPLKRYSVVDGSTRNYILDIDPYHTGPQMASIFNDRIQEVIGSGVIFWDKGMGTTQAAYKLNYTIKSGP